jgi:hypothetical protein
MNQTALDSLQSLEFAASKSRTLIRQDLREVLVDLGRMYLEGQEAEAAPHFARLETLRDTAGERFAVALREELSMAITEHVRSCDPRYLENPKYDLVYTVEARERLEARLEVAERLGLPAEEGLLEAVARADALLQPLIDRQGS